MSLQVHLACAAPSHFIFFTTSGSHAMFLNSCNKVAPCKKVTKVHSANKQKATFACVTFDVLCTQRN